MAKEGWGIWERGERKLEEAPAIPDLKPSITSDYLSTRRKPKAKRRDCLLPVFEALQAKCQVPYIKGRALSIPLSFAIALLNTWLRASSVFSP